MLLCPLFPELAKLSHHYLCYAGSYWIPILEDVLKEILEQLKKMLAYRLRVGRRYPNLSIIAHAVTRIPGDRSDRYGVAIWPSMRVIGAVCPKGVLNGYVPDLTVGLLS